MKKKKKQMIVVNVSEVKTRSGWNGVKPYTRVQTPKTVSHRACDRGCTPERKKTHECL